MEAELSSIVVEGGVELVGPMDPAAIHDHHDLFAGCAEGGHDLMEILAELLGIKVRHNFIEDFGGPILDRANHAEQHAAGDPAPGAIASPRLAFEGLLTFDLTLAQGTEREAGTLGGAPPARPRQGKAPQDRFIDIEQNDLAPARLVLKGSECQRAVGEISWGWGQLAGGAVVAEVFFLTHCGYFRGPGGPRCHGRRRSPARDNSIGNGGTRAPEGLDR